MIGTGSASSADYLRSLGAEPVVYGDGLADRVRRMGAPTAALDLHGSDTVHAARELGVTDSRICMIAGVVPGVQTANGASAGPEALQSLARRVAAGEITVPLAATFPLEEFRAAIEMQAGRHVRGKVVIEVSGA